MKIKLGKRGNCGKEGRVSALEDGFFLLEKAKSQIF